MKKGFLLILIVMTSTGLSASKTVQIFKDAHVYFGSGTNRRTLDSTVALPDTGEFSTIKLNLRVHCPKKKCDWWDRKGALSILTDDGQEIELMRFITPYRVGASWSTDLTDLQPVLTGTSQFQVFIDTWVGPGHAQGDGWMVDASLEFTEGTPEREVIQVIPVTAATSIEYGNPELKTMISKSLKIPQQSTHAKLRYLVTGHGQGNSENCAEFCPKSHTVQIGDWTRSKMIWRNNCRETQTDGPQKGTWIYDRAGWCPGDKVIPWYIDIPDALLEDAGTLDISWYPESYKNDERGDYNNGGHTKPYYRVSSLLILYR